MDGRDGDSTDQSNLLNYSWKMGTIIAEQLVSMGLPFDTKFNDTTIIVICNVTWCSINWLIINKKH